MAYPDFVKNEIKEASDIVDIVGSYVDLRQRGANFIGLCPFHRERSPSFNVSQAGQFYHCFGCGAGGDVYTFVQNIENINFIEALEFLANRANYNLPEKGQERGAQNQLKKRLYEIHLTAARYFYDCLISPAGAGTAQYLSQRRVSMGARKVFGLGYASADARLWHLLSKNYSQEEMLASGLVLQGKGQSPLYDRFRNRLIFPIMDASGRIIGFGGRDMANSDIKYLNSPQTLIFDKSNTLYSLNFAKKAFAKRADASSQTQKLAEEHLKRSIILVEGYMDVISLYQQGIRNVIAPLGTAFTERQADILKRSFSEVILLFDGDGAGERAALRAIAMLQKKGIDHRVVWLADAKDPDEYILRYGPIRLLNEIINALDPIYFQINLAKRGYNLENAASRSRFFKEAAGIVAALPNPIDRETYHKEIAEKYGIESQALKEEMIRSLKHGEDIKTAEIAQINIPKDAPLNIAKKHIICTMAENRAFAQKIAASVSSFEFGESIYIQVFDIILQLWGQYTQEYPEKPLVAKILSYFEGNEEAQRRVAQIFFANPEYDGADKLQKALNDHIRLLKLSYIEKEILKGEIHRLTELASLKKEIQARKEFL